MNGKATWHKATRRGRGSSPMRVHRDPTSNLTLDELAHNRQAKNAVSAAYLMVVTGYVAMLLLPGMDGPPDWYWAIQGWASWVAYKALDWWWPS